MAIPYGTQDYDSRSRRRLTQIILFVIIIATLPCYVIGAVLLAVAPQEDDTEGDIVPTTLAPLTPALTSPTGQFTPVQAFTSLPTTTLQSTPGQFIAPTRQRYTNTPLPSATFAPSITASVTLTFTPTWTWTWTFTPTFTFTPTPITPTATFTETPSPTLTPTFTET